MDPNEALKRLRLMMDWDWSEDDMDEVKELFNGLDEWISKGGFLPTSWNVERVM